MLQSIFFFKLFSFHMHIMLQIVKFYEIFIHPTRKPYVDFIIQYLVINTEMTFYMYRRRSIIWVTISLFLINFSPIFFWWLIFLWLLVFRVSSVSITNQMTSKACLLIFFFSDVISVRTLNRTNKICEINHAFTYRLPTIFYVVMREYTLFIWNIKQCYDLT